MRGRMIIWIRRCAGLLLVVSVFSPLSTSTGLGASPTLPVPRTRGYMRALVNVNQGLPAYAAYMGKEGLLTDLEYQYGQATPVQNFAQAKSWFASRFPSASLGVYCSSRAVQSATTQEYDPPNCLTPDLFAESELLPTTFLDYGRRIVDYRQASARLNSSRELCSSLNRGRSNGCTLIIGRTPTPGEAISPGTTP